MSRPLPPVMSLPVPPSTASTYTDLNGLAALKKDSRSPQAIAAIAQQVDALFLQMMLKSMRDAGAAEGETDSNEMGMYQDMFDKQIALTLSQHQSLGLGSLVTGRMAADAAASAARPGAATAAPGASAPGARPGPAGTAIGDAASGTRPGPAGTAAGAAASGTRTGTPTAATGDQSAARAAPAGMAPNGPPPGTPTAPAGAADDAPHKPAPPPTTLLQSASHFVSQVLPAITRAANALGVSPLGMLAQAALETGWGTRMARTAAGAPSLNMFGLKADDAWGGARAGATTLEFSGGVATQRYAVFRAYGSIDESVSDFAQLLEHSPRYRGAVAAGGNAQAYVDHISQAGYATDPQYANKLTEVLHGGILRMALAAAGRKL